MNRIKTVCIILFIFLSFFNRAFSATDKDSVLNGSLDSLSAIIKSDFNEIQKQIKQNEINKKKGESGKNIYFFNSSATLKQSEDGTYLYWEGKMKHPSVKKSYGVNSSNDETAINNVLGKIEAETGKKVIVYMASLITYPKPGEIQGRGQGGAIYYKVDFLTNKLYGIIDKELYNDPYNKTFTTLIVIRIAEFIITVEKNAKGTTIVFDEKANVDEKFRLKHTIKISPANNISATCVQNLREQFQRKVTSNLAGFVNDIYGFFKNQTCDPAYDCTKDGKDVNDAIASGDISALSKAIDGLLYIGNGRYRQVKYGDKGLSYDLYQKILTNCISLNNRIKAIKIIISGFHTYSIHETIAIDFIRYMPEGDRNALLDKLITEKDADNKACLLYAIVDAIEGDNLNLFFNTIAPYIKKYKSSDLTLDQAYSNFEKENFNKVHIFGRSYVESEVSIEQSLNAEGQVTLKSYTNGVRSFLSPYPNHFSLNSKNVNPYSYVLVYFMTDYVLGEKTYLKGQEELMPSIIVYGLFNHENNRRIGKTVQLAIDIALFAVGVGEINLALESGNAFRWIKGIIDLGVGASDLTINHLLEPKLESSPEGRVFLSHWAKFQMAYGAVSLTAHAINMRKSANALLDDAKDGKLTTDNGQVPVTKEQTDNLEAITKKAEELAGVSNIAIDGNKLAKYSKIRTYLSDGKVKAYLNNQQLIDFENLLKTANEDVLNIINNFKNADEFAEMTRGYLDSPTGFANAIKNLASFDGEHGWLSFWRLTPRMENSLNTIAKLKSESKLGNVGNATDIQIASIHSYTANGDFINVPYRYQPTWFGSYNSRAVKHINEGLDELRKIPERVVKQTVFSGKTFSKTDFENKFVGKINTEHHYKGYMSTSKLESVAEGFIILTKQWVSGNGDNIAIIQRIIPKNGVYIDDFSDWGKNLGKANHSTANIKVQVQEEVLLNSQKLKQVSEPIPVMENGVHKTIDGMKVYYVDFIEVL